jgi:hypothetical protein
MNEKTLEMIADAIDAAETLIGKLGHTDAARPMPTAPIDRQANWKAATEHLATARILADGARVRVRAQAFVRRMIVSHIDRLTDELREVVL